MFLAEFEDGWLTLLRCRVVATHTFSALQLDGAGCRLGLVPPTFLDHPLHLVYGDVLDNNEITRTGRRCACASEEPAPCWGSAPRLGACLDG